MRGLLPHPDRRDHSFAGAARKRFSHHHAVWSRCTVFVVRKKQRDDAETSGEKISRKHESMVGRTTGRLSRSRARRESMRRKRSEEHTSELQSRFDLVCRLLLEKKKKQKNKRKIEKH